MPEDINTSIRAYALWATLGGVSAAGVFHYLEETGWVREDHPRPGIRVYVAPVPDDNGDSMRVVLPEELTRDTANDFAAAIDLLCVVNALPVPALLERLRG